MEPTQPEAAQMGKRTVQDGSYKMDILDDTDPSPGILTPLKVGLVL
ncbi:hypothetical protein [Echinicola soli]|nr:hypothetical protein [Echinicola soli]